MFCCKKKPEQRRVVSAPIGVENNAYETEANAFKPAYDIELPVRRTASPKYDIPLRNEQMPDLPPRDSEPIKKPVLPVRNPLAKVLPTNSEKTTNKPNIPTAVVQPSGSEKSHTIKASGHEKFAEIREAIAIRDYTGDEVDELTIVKGDLLEVVVVSTKTWWDGRMKATGKQGVVNASHLSLKPSSIKSRQNTEKDEDNVFTIRDSITSSSSTGGHYRPWFKGTVTRKQAEKLLMRADTKKGSFLVREDEDQLVFILGVKGEDNSSKNYEIKKNRDNAYFIFPENKFDTLDALVMHYSENTGGLLSQLSVPCGMNGEVEENDKVPEDDMEGDYQTTRNRKSSIHEYDTHSERGTSIMLHKEVYDDGMSAIEVVAVAEQEEEEPSAVTSQQQEQEVPSAVTSQPPEQEVYEELSLEAPASKCNEDCETVEVIHNFDATKADELSITKGETLHVVDRVGLWWLAHKPGSTEEGLIPSNFVANSDDLEKFPWYFGQLGGEETEACLMKDGNQRGTFLVRKSGSQEDRHTISILDLNEEGKKVIRNVRICSVDNGDVFIYKGENFSSIPELVKNTMGLDKKYPLLHPCLKSPNNA